MIKPLQEALSSMDIPFMHPELFAEKTGCSASALKNGFADGSIPFCTPFAKDDSKRPIRYVHVDIWREQLRETSK